MLRHSAITAALEDTELSADGLSVRAVSSETDALLDGKIVTASIAGGGGTGAAVGGALSVNVITSTVDAHISGGSDVTARGGDVEVSVADSSTITVRRPRWMWADTGRLQRWHEVVPTRCNASRSSGVPHPGQCTANPSGGRLGVIR